MRTQGTYSYRGAEGRTEGRKAKNYVPPLFFEKAGDNKLANQPELLLKTTTFGTQFFRYI